MEDAGIETGEGNARGLAAVAELLGWFGLLGIVISLVVYYSSKDRFVRFHAMQAVLMELFVLALMLVEVLIAIVLLITIIGYFFMIAVIIATSFSALALRIYLAYKAYNGAAPMLPAIGKIAKDQVG
jgi:uncharacterized membrane protein